MSLINEALKKAQRQRSDQPPGMMTPVGDRTEQRGPLRTQSIVLLAAGAAVLVGASVAITVYLVNRSPANADSPLAKAPVVTPAPGPDSSAPTPVVLAPVVPAPITVADTPVEAVAPIAAVPVVAAPVEIPPVTVVPQPELHIQLFVDAIRVMGIRSQGGESKVLMNDRVYRVNDIVDRTLVLKLVKVEPELLTFADPNGVLYTKSF